MKKANLHRRDFSRISLAAFGGLLTGAAAYGQRAAPAKGGAAVKPAPAPKAPKNAKNAPKADTVVEEYKPPEAPDHSHVDNAKIDWPPKEIHVCRGLNTCKNRGRSGKNECAGQGTCATTKTSPHECSTFNDCKGQGGCNGKAGKNECAGLGDGAVPIIEGAWVKLRADFESKMKRLSKRVGPAPSSKNERRTEEGDARRKAEYEAAAAEEAAAAAEAEGTKPRQGARRTAPKSAGSKSAGAPKNGTAKAKPKATATKPKTAAKDQEPVGDGLLDELTGGDDKKKSPAKKPAPKKAP